MLATFIKCNDCQLTFLARVETGIVTCPKCGATDKMTVTFTEKVTEDMI